jgi:nucleoside-triphosphatase
VRFDGETAVMADRARRGGPRVGRYGVDVSVIDRVGVPALAAQAGEVHLVDEIGRMECLSPAFIAAVRALLASQRPLVATVAQRGGGFIAEVKRRADVEVWTVSRANRDEMPARVLAWLEPRLAA